MASIVLDEKTGPIWISRPCFLFGFWTMSLARLVLLGLCRSLSLLLGLRLLVGEHLLLDEHAVGLRRVLLLGHVLYNILQPFHPVQQYQPLLLPLQ